MTSPEGETGTAGTPVAAIQTVVAGLVAGFLAIVLSIGFANLILPGELRAFTPVMVGMALFSTMILNAVSALTSPIRGGASTVQEVPIVVLAGSAAAIAAAMAGVAERDIAITIAAFLMLTTTLTGLVLLLLGLFRLGSLIRFMPYPVVGGFLAGTGWLILQGGLTVIIGAPVALDNVGVLVESAVLIKCGLGALFIAIVVLLRTRFSGSLILPAAILAAIVLYNLGVAAGGFAPAALRSAGWLIPLPPDGSLWPPLTPADLTAIDWQKAASGSFALPGLFVVTVMALLMNAASIELDRRSDIDLDRELRSLGVQNMIAGPTGGLPGYLSVSLTFLADRLGGGRRGVGLVAAGLCAAAIFFGDIVLGIVPTPLLGSLLVWIGGALMIEWLIGSYRRLAILEYAIIVLIFLVIVFVGFTWGILVGLAAAIALFVIEYSRADIVRQFARGDRRQSNFEGSAERREALHRHGDAILIYRLQGYLFFGTADGLRKRILSDAAATPEHVGARYVVIDFRRVTGIDSSAVLSFARLAQAAAAAGFTVVVACATASVRAALERGAIESEGKCALRFEVDVEHALTACENALLAEVAPEAGSAGARSIGSILARLLKSEADANALAAYLERVEVAAGDTVIHEGAASNEIYVFEQGRAAVTTKSDDGMPLLLASLGPGAVVGEVAFYTGTQRSASVTTEEPSVVWRLSRDALNRLQARNPELAARFHERLATMLAERLANTDRLLGFLAE